MHGDWFRHGVEQPEEHRAACLQRGRVAPVRPVPLSPGAEKSRLYAVKHIAILQEHLPELADVSEDAVHVLRIGAVVPAGEPVRETDDRLQPVPPNRRECLLYFLKLLRGEISLLECFQVDLDQQQCDPARAGHPVGHAIAHAGRVETTFRVRESLWNSPGSEFPAMAARLRLSPPGVEA